MQIKTYVQFRGGNNHEVNIRGAGKTVLVVFKFLFRSLM
jgi:hypothetical protein